MIAPPVSAPAQRGMPVITFRIVAPAISCPASSASEPSADQRRGHAAHRGAVAELEVVAGRVEVVLLGQRHSRGATKNAKTSEPSPAEPTHHQALMPSR